jgi:general secretion pathway protein D
MRRALRSSWLYRLAPVLVTIIVLASASGQAPPPPQPRPVGGLNFNNASLLEVINALAQELHINYVLDASVKTGSVTINTYGSPGNLDLRSLLETILRMNNLVMVQAGNIFRIVPAANAPRQPISPVSQTDPSKLPDDERLSLNLVFLRFVTSAEMLKVLQPFIGDGGQITSYDPANLLIILDNSRNMKRTLELINLFDSDTFAGQRVRAFEVKNGRPYDIAKELEEIFKAYSLGGSKDRGAIQFLPLSRISTILAVAPNPGAFTEVEKWLAKLDIPSKVTAGSTDNHVYKLMYGRAEILGAVVSQLYGIPTPFGYGGFGGGYGMPGNSMYPSSGYAGGGGMGSPYGGGGYGSPYGGGGGYGSPYGGGGYGSPYGGGGYGSPYGGGGYGSPYGGGGYGSPFGGGAGYAPQASPMAGFSNPASGGAAATTTGGAGGTTAATAAGDQTGSYLGAGQSYGGFGYLPRIIPNPFDNTIIVQSTPEQWEQIKGLLEQLDISPRQVLIDAKIYEVDLTGEFSAGVETFLQQRNAANPTGIPSRQFLGSNSTVNGTLQTVLSAGTLVGQSRQLLAMLQLQESRTKAKVLSAPSVIATDSIPASITVGDSVPTLTSQAVNAGVTSGGNSLFTQTISNTSTGIGLNILARVNSSGIVTMVINQSVTAPEPNPSGTSINSPSFSQRNVSTQVTVQDGDTIAIGGIINEATTDTSAGIPLLDRLPYIGGAFGLKTASKKRTELIIFLTPRVIYDTNQVADATEELKQKVRTLRRAIRNEQ